MFQFIAFFTLISLLCAYLRYKYTYWETRDVKQLKTDFLLGNIFKLNSIHLADLLHNVYTQFRGKAKVAGTYVFARPIAVVLDLDVIKTILIKDFNKFVDRSEYRNESADPISANLFALYGEKWRHMRTKLSPTFTSGKMKMMFGNIATVSEQFESAITRQLEKSTDGVIELHDLMARYTTDVIGSCAFGIETNSLKDPNAEFRRMGRKLFYERILSIRLRLFKITYLNVLKYLGIKRFSSEELEFYLRIVRDTVLIRERDNIQRNDFINMLIEMRKQKDEHGQPSLSIEQLAAQVFVFFVAGFETSSSSMSYSIYELAKHPAIQEKLRTEIREVLERHDGEISYETIMEMPYLDQVVNETLRLYPPLPSLTRIAEEDYVVPDTSIRIDKGTKVYIPVREIHTDPELYDNPMEFRPERFDAAVVKNRHPQAFLPFGDGPRNCIGLRFARMQVRVGLITLLKSFRFSMAERTPDNMEFSNNTIVLVPARGVWLKVEKL